MRATRRPPARCARPAAAGPTRWITRRRQHVEARLGLDDHRLDGALGHARVVLQRQRGDVVLALACARARSRRSWRRRRRRCARPAARRVRRRRRNRPPGCGRAPWPRPQPPVTGGKNATSAPSRSGVGLVGHHLVDRHAHRAPGRQRLRVRVRLRAQPRAQGAGGRLAGGRPVERLAGAQRLAQRGEVLQRAASWRQLRQRQVAHHVARLHGLPRRDVDQAIAPGQRGQHAGALVAETGRARPRRCGARAGTRGACRACGQSKSARIGDGRPACRAGAPCRRSSTGRTNSRKVTKLDTGLPGRPMNQVSPSPPSLRAPRRTPAACPA